MSNHWTSPVQASAFRSANLPAHGRPRPLPRLIACLVTLVLISSAAQNSPAQNLRALASAAPRALAAYGVVSAGDFSLHLSTNVIGASARLNGTGVVTITPVDGFSSPVALACSGLPLGALCTFTPQSVTPTAGPATSNLSISYSPAAASAVHPSPSPLVPVSALACVIVLFRIRKQRNLLLAVLALCSLGVFVGCGSPNSTLHTYSVTLDATSGSLEHTTSFLLTVE
ncbi:MAG TPA: hypothetical protein VK716_10990 [Terracidiphilus sp.]|jgi:hypothetical protein|nr:hypothetical protein [Terracidiphilus sp.]